MKKTGKKMVLTRETLRTLNENAVRAAGGGLSGPGSCNASCITEITCFSCRLHCFTNACPPTMVNC